MNTSNSIENRARSQQSNQTKHNTTPTSTPQRINQPPATHPFVWREDPVDVLPDSLAGPVRQAGSVDGLCQLVARYVVSLWVVVVVETSV